MKRVAIALLLGFCLLIAYVLVMAWRSPPIYELETDRIDYPLLSWDDYRAIAQSVTPPVVHQKQLGSGAVLIFGAQHVSDPAHPQFAALDRAYAAFSPDVVLVEGRMGFVLPPFMNPIEAFGESGALAAKAKRDGLPLHTWELCRPCEPEQLRERFSDRQVALYLLLRPYSGADGTSIETARERMVAIIADRGKRPGITGVIANMDEFDAAWAAEFPDGTSWHEMRGIYRGPGFLNSMFEYGNDIRDRHLLNVIRELTDDGQKVMVTVGWSHAVRIEPALAVMESTAP